jgi:hypothetical protein
VAAHQSYPMEIKITRKIADPENSALNVLSHFDLTSLNSLNCCFGAGGFALHLCALAPSLQSYIYTTVRD